MLRGPRFGPGAIYERTGETVEEQQVTVTLAQRQKIGGQWYKPGDEVEVYQQDAYGLTKRGVVRPGTGADLPYLNEEAATDLDREAQAANRAKVDERHAEGVKQALGGPAGSSRDADSGPAKSRAKKD